MPGDVGAWKMEPSMQSNDNDRTNRDIIALIQRAIDEFNKQSSPDRRLAVDSETPLFGREGKLDSLGLVNLILLVEERISRELSISITLVEEPAISRRHNPFRTVASLAEYIAERLRERELSQSSP